MDQLRWLYRRRRRVAGSKQQVEPSDARLEAMLAVEEGDASPLAASLERRQLFRAALARLTSTQRELVLASANGHSHEEIRDHFGYANVNTAKTRIAHARRRFISEAAAVGLTPRSLRKQQRKDGKG